MLRSLLLSSLALNLGLLIGRLSGFAREAFIASTYGATAEADIVVLMLTVPDLLVGILMGGAMGAALVPEFSQRPERSRQLLYQSLWFFGLLFTGLACGLYWQAEALVTLLVPGFEYNQIKHGAVAIGWVIWLIPLTVLSGVVTAYLHAINRFAVAALGTLIINSAIIVGLVLVYAGYGTMFLLALFVLLGGILRLLSQLSQVRVAWNPFESLRPALLDRALLTRYGQAMLSGSALLLFPVVARALASFHGDGSVALFNYAVRLIEFPLAVAVTFLAAVFFPRLAKSYTDDQEQHRQQIRYGVQITLALSLIAMIVLISLNEAYTQAVYGYGSMDQSNLRLVTTLICVGLITLPLQGLSSFLTAVFNARKNTRTPLFINSLGLVFFLLISSSELFGKGLEALMWGMVASYALICVLQLMFLKIEMFKWHYVFLDSAFLAGIICASVLSGLLSYWFSLADFTVWVSLALGAVTAFVSLSIMALFNRDLRSIIKFKMSNK